MVAVDFVHASCEELQRRRERVYRLLGMYDLLVSILFFTIQL